MVSNHHVLRDDKKILPCPFHVELEFQTNDRVDVLWVGNTNSEVSELNLISIQSRF